MAQIPSDERYQEAWGALSFSDRRRIMRAVNRGDALEDPGEAALAVVTADRQERFWSWIWLLGPLGALLFLLDDLLAFLVNAVLLTVVLGGLSWWRLRRVRRARARNRAVATGARRRSGRRDGGGRGTGGSGADGSGEGGSGRGGSGRGHIPRRGAHRQLPPQAKGVRPGAGRPKRSRRDRRRGG